MLRSRYVESSFGDNRFIAGLDLDVADWETRDFLSMCDSIWSSIKGGGCEKWALLVTGELSETEGVEKASFCLYERSSELDKESEREPE